MYGLVLNFLYLRLSIENCTIEPWSSFAEWLRAVRENRDTIITTNYDTLIENTLSHDLTGVFCTSGSEREFTLEGSWYADEEIQAGADRDAATAG